MLALPPSSFPQAPQGGEQIRGDPQRGESLQVEPCIGTCGTRWGCGCQEEAGTSCAQPGARRRETHGSKWRHRTSSRPGWELGARGTAGEQRLAFIPPVLSPAAPRCLPALDCSCIFSASAVYWVTLMQTHTHKERAIWRGSSCATDTASPSPAPGSTVGP